MLHITLSHCSPNLILLKNNHMNMIPFFLIETLQFEKCKVKLKFEEPEKITLLNICG